MNLGPTREATRLTLRPHRLSDLDACFLSSGPEAVRMVCEKPLNSASLRIAEKLAFHPHGRAQYRSKKVTKLRCCRPTD